MTAAAAAAAATTSVFRCASAPGRRPEKSSRRWGPLAGNRPDRRAAATALWCGTAGTAAGANTLYRPLFFCGATGPPVGFMTTR